MPDRAHSWGIFGALGAVGRQSDPSAGPSPCQVHVRASAVCPYPRSPSRQTSPRSRSPGRTSSGWGCSARSHTGTGNTGSSSGLLLGFLARRGESCEPQGHLSTAQRWEQLREHHLSGPSTFLPLHPQHSHSSQPSLCCLHCFVCALRGQTPPLISEPEQNPPEHGRNGGANPAALK